MFSSKNETFYTNSLDFPHSNGCDKTETASKIAFFKGKEGYVFGCPFTTIDVIDAITIKGHNVDELINFLKEKFFVTLMKLEGKFAVIVGNDVKAYPYEVIKANDDHGMKFTLHEAISAFINEHSGMTELIPANDFPADYVSADVLADNVPKMIESISNDSALDIAKLIFSTNNDNVNVNVGFYIANNFYSFSWPFARDYTLCEVEEHMGYNPDEIITRIMRKHYKTIYVDETKVKLIAKDEREYCYTYAKFENAHIWRSKTPNWLVSLLVDINLKKCKDNATSKFDLEKKELESSNEKITNKSNILEDELTLTKVKLNEVQDELSNIRDELSATKNELTLTKTELSNIKDETIPVSLITKIIIDKIADSEKANLLDYFKTDEAYLFNWLIKNTESKFTQDLVIELFKRRFKLAPSKRWEFSVSEVNNYSNNILFNMYCDEIKTIHVFATDLKKGSILREFIDYVEGTNMDNRKNIKVLMNHIIENKLINTNHKLVIIHILDKIAY